MAEGTRMESLEESVRKTAIQVQKINEFVARSQIFTNSSLEESVHKTDLQLQQINHFMAMSQNFMNPQPLMEESHDQSSLLASNPNSNSERWEFLGANFNHEAKRPVRQGQSMDGVLGVDLEPPEEGNELGNGDQNSSCHNGSKEGMNEILELEFPVFDPGGHFGKAVSGLEVKHSFRDFVDKGDIVQPIVQFSGVDFGLMNDMNELELKFVERSIDCNKIEMGLPSILRKFLAITPAHDMFDEMPVRGFRESDSNTQLNRAHFVMGNKVFDPRGLLDQGWALLNSSYAAVLVHRCLVLDSFVVFDPGGVLGLLIAGLALDPRVCTTTVESDIANQRLQWDPGGSGCYYSSSKAELVLLENSLLV